MKEDIQKLIDKYNRGAKIHENQSNRKDASPTEKNRASYQQFLCEAIVEDLQQLITKQ